MKRKGILFAIFAMLLMFGTVVIIAGCDKGSALVGKWIGKGGSDPLEFFSDGTADLDRINGEWKIEKGKIIISEGGRSYTAKISGSTLTLFNEDGDEEGVWQRVKK
jgi:hypothetical protein